MFFLDNRIQFFKPLTSKYREQVIECLRLLYDRLYSANADYGESLRREQIIEIFEEALTRAPVLESDDGEVETRFKTQREQASWILNNLIEFGWVEKQVDSVTLQSTYPFSRMGRLFTQPLVESGQTSVRTRHRNTRNTLNSLEAFLSRGEVHDLLDAYEYSERIISDFTDVIAELEERKRELVKEVEAQVLVQQATDQFFDFMEKRFQPDLSIRLSADSVEKHRDDIQNAITKVRRKRKDFKATAEKKLRYMAPELIQPGQSVLWTVLDTIEMRMRKAAELMLPALRSALQSFTKRADIIIRQLSYLNTQANSDVVSVCNQLGQLPAKEFDARLLGVAELMAGVSVGLIDPEQVKLQNKRQKRLVRTEVVEQVALDKSARQDLFIQQLLDQAFVVSGNGIRQYAVDAMVKGQLKSGRKMSTRHLPVDSASDLLAMAHIIEVGAVNNLSSEYLFNVEYVKLKNGEERPNNDFYHHYDEFTIELIEKN